MQKWQELIWSDKEDKKKDKISTVYEGQGDHQF